MSNSPKTPILHTSRYAPSIEKSSQTHRSTFHLSNLFHSITKFRRTIRTNNNNNTSFVRATSTNSNDQQVKLTRRSFNKNDSLSSSSSINRPSSCFVLLSPSKHDHQTCLFFQKPNEEIVSPKVNSNSSFSKIKRVSSFLLPLKRRQSLSLNHSLHERSFKAKESTKRRSRLLNYSIFKSKISPVSLSSFNGRFGYQIQQPCLQAFPRPSAIGFDLINIDLILERRLTTFYYNNYQSIIYDTPNWSWIQWIKPFFGILFQRQMMIFFQPKLFATNHSNVSSIHSDFIYLPIHHQLKYDEEFSSIHIGYDQSAPTTIRIPLHWISTTNRLVYQISSKDIE